MYIYIYYMVYKIIQEGLTSNRLPPLQSVWIGACHIDLRRYGQGRDGSAARNLPVGGNTLPVYMEVSINAGILMGYIWV